MKTEKRREEMYSFREEKNDSEREKICSKSKRNIAAVALSCEIFGTMLDAVLRFLTYR